MYFLDSVYKTFVISTIVDIDSIQPLHYLVYKTFVISTIVDQKMFLSPECRL